MRINEIFYSIQGEGAHTGTAATFVRFAGCNLKCYFCDTDHQPYVRMSEEEIVELVAQNPARLVVVTGGEPSLQLTASLVDKLHAIGKYVSVETNGTHPLPPNVDWITCSPKQLYVGEAGRPRLQRVNEVKVVFDNKGEVSDYGLEADHYFLQPLDTGNKIQNAQIIAGLFEYIKQHPKWRLSLQTHKIINVP